MEPLHLNTPLLHSPALSRGFGAEVWLKMDALQPVGSFKIRGMGALCQRAHAEGARRFVCASGGNAGYAVAYAGRLLGVPVTIATPTRTFDYMRDLLRREGAEVVVHGEAWDETHQYALSLAEAQGAAYIHPFDDPRIWEGHASLVHEVAGAGVRPDAVVTSVGGGGLLCGIIQGLQQLGWHDVPVLAVETEGAASFAEAVRAGHLVTLERIQTIATTLAARTVAEAALRMAREHPVAPWLVSDRQAVSACARFLDDHRVLVEPACGASLAAVYDPAEPLAGKERVLVVVCGGAGVNRELLAGWMAQTGLS